MRERERVLFATWACVGRVDDLGLDRAGRIAVVDVAGESIVLTRDRDGLHAAYNVCRHRGSQLVPAEPGAEPACSAVGALRCPYHSWTYSLAGRLLKAPHTDGIEIDPDEFALHPVGVAAWAGFVFVNLAAEPASPVAGQIGPPVQRLARYPLVDLRRGTQVVYDVKANWKIVMENYNECYHCGPVHPELCALVPAFRERGGAGLDWDDGIPHRPGAWTFTLNGTSTPR